MIRRDAISAAGVPCWVLIMQPDHARLAGRCAEAWGAPAFTRLEPHAELIAAIDRHDDGWAAWEQELQVESDSGRPRQFVEMPVEQSLEIWTRSIESAASVGYLAGYVVSGHFSALLERFSARWQGSAKDELLARGFLDRQAALREVWLSRWLAQKPGMHTEALAGQALEYLQFFDVLSLWLCCGERSAPESFQPPDGPAITMTPLTRREYKVSPWPFLATHLELEIPGREVPAAHFRNNQELADAAWRPVELKWLLLPC